MSFWMLGKDNKFRDIIWWKYVCCMYGTATFIKVSQLRYDSFSQKYQGTSVQVLIAFNGKVLLLVKALVFLLLAAYYLKHIFKVPTIRNLNQLSNVSSHEWQNWKVDNGSSILSGLVVNLYNSKWLKYCVMILLVARRRVIIMIATEADSDKRLTRVLNRLELVLIISFIVLSCINVKLYFLFVLYIQKGIDNMCNNCPWAW